MMDRPLAVPCRTCWCFFPDSFIYLFIRTTHFAGRGVKPSQLILSFYSLPFPSPVEVIKCLALTPLTSPGLSWMVRVGRCSASLWATPKGKEKLLCNIYFLSTENSIVGSSFHMQGFVEIKQSYFLERKMTTVIRFECHNYIHSIEALLFSDLEKTEM